MSASCSRKVRAPDRYTPQEVKEHILSTSSVKASDPKVRKALSGTIWDKGCSLASLYCDEGKDSYELSGGIGGPLELVDGNDHDHCVESGGKRLSNSVIVGVGKSKVSKENEELSE